MPGLELRLPVLFDAMVSRGRLGLAKFVELTATAPGQDLRSRSRQGHDAVGADADLAVWDPDRTVAIVQGPRHDRAGYTPFAGRTIKGWPVDGGAAWGGDRGAGTLLAALGSGRFLPRAGEQRRVRLGRSVAALDRTMELRCHLATVISAVWTAAMRRSTLSS